MGEPYEDDRNAEHARRAATVHASSFTDRNDGRKEPSAYDARYSARSAVVKTKKPANAGFFLFQRLDVFELDFDIVALVFFLASVRALQPYALLQERVGVDRVLCYIHYSVPVKSKTLTP